MPKLNEAVVKSLPTLPINKLYPFAGAVVQGATVPRGFFVRVTKDGARAFCMDYRIGAKQRRYTIGRWPDWTVLGAVREARELRQRIDRGEDPLGERNERKEARKAAARSEPQAEETVANVLDEFMAGFKGRRLRRPDNYTDAFERLVKPAIGSVPIHSLKRAQVAAMLNDIEANNGPVMADRTHTYLSSALNWYAGQDDDFDMPRLRGLKRATSQRRDRVLSDDEIRLLMLAAETQGTFGAAVRFLLLTGQRRGDVLGFAWSELAGSTWTIPGSRYKTGEAHTVELSRAALEIVEAQPRRGRLVFPDPDGEVCNTIGFRKHRLDRAMAELNNRKPIEPRWTLHDLRRTARSLMARAGVRPDIAERVVGHAVGNSVGRIYDRHTYEADKRAAMEALARLIADILDPSPANVVPIRGAAG